MVPTQLDADPPAYECDICGQVTYHPRDVKEGYCGMCHTWTRNCTCSWEAGPDGRHRLYRNDPDCEPHYGWKVGRGG